MKSGDIEAAICIKSQYDLFSLIPTLTFGAVGKE